MKFNYQARTKEGEIQVGVVQASSKETALSLLQKHGFYVTYLEEAKAPIYAQKISFLQRTSLRDIVLFSRQLSMMFAAKVPLVEALRVLAGQTDNPGFKEQLFKISEDIEGGSPFSKALARYPKLFSSFYTAMVKAGEASGKLSDSLNYLAEHLEREYHLASKTKGALIYPALVFMLVSFVIGLMIYVVIPQLQLVILESGAKIPDITARVIWFSDFAKDYGAFLAIGAVILLIILARYYRTESGQLILDKIFLKLPIMGEFLKTLYLSRLAESLSTLISGGLMITKAIELSSDIVGNTQYKKAMVVARDEVRKGVPVSSVLALYPEIFPPIFVQMTLVGEKTGSLDTSLLNMAGFYQREVERGIDNILSILEPVLIIGLGGVVGGLMLSILMPLYQLMTI
jgi:type IV pilus assembly protein PilC